MDRSTVLEILNYLPVAVAITEDCECRKITVNKKMASIMKTVYSEDIAEDSSFTSSPFYKTYHNGEELRQEDFPLRQAVLKGIEVTDFEMDIVRPDGSTATVVACATPWLEDGEIVGGFALYEDVGELRRLETEVQSLRAQLNDAIEAKMAVEHELAGS